MENIEIYTIGVYGSDAESFFKKLTDKKIDTFVDIRRRRGVRGSEYSFVNSMRLQDRLSVLGIKYLHVMDLSPTDEIRKIQYVFDKEIKTSQRKRELLSEKFISVYEKEILGNFNFQNFLGQLYSMNTKRAALFCVEKNASACHRSVVAEHLSKSYGFRITNL